MEMLTQWLAWSVILGAIWLGAWALGTLVRDLYEMGGWGAILAAVGFSTLLLLGLYAVLWAVATVVVMWR